MILKQWAATYRLCVQLCRSYAGITWTTIQWLGILEYCKAMPGHDGSMWCTTAGHEEKLTEGAKFKFHLRVLNTKEFYTDCCNVLATDCVCISVTPQGRFRYILIIRGWACSSIPFSDQVGFWCHILLPVNKARRFQLSWGQYSPVFAKHSKSGSSANKQQQLNDMTPSTLTGDRRR